MEWQLIETAPKDGETVLAFWRPRGYTGPISHKNYGLTIYEDGRWADPDDDDWEYGEPTHWMPLPDAPKGSTP